MTVTSNLVPVILSEYGAMTRAALRDYLPLREPRRHLYDLVAEYPLRGGKMMRSSLCIAAACAFGARPQDALDLAVSIELDARANGSLRLHRIRAPLCMKTHSHLQVYRRPATSVLSRKCYLGGRTKLSDSQLHRRRGGFDATRRKGIGEGQNS
jgi:hypothetical protein